MKKKWDPAYLIGIDTLDNQHKIIFDLINDLGNAIDASADARIITTLLDVIETYVFRHFQTEEELFQNRKDKTAHILSHYTLIKDFHTFRLSFRNRNISREIVSVLLDTWLLDHITKTDLPFFKQAITKEEQPQITGKVDEYPLEPKEKRRHKRIPHKKITDSEIVVECYNTSVLKSSQAVIVDISMGGMRLSSSEQHKIGDLVLVSCHIGKSFKMKEKVRIRHVAGTLYGTEFISLSPGSETFLAELYGAVSQRNF